MYIKELCHYFETTELLITTPTTNPTGGFLFIFIVTYSSFFLPVFLTFSHFPFELCKFSDFSNFTFIYFVRFYYNIFQFLFQRRYELFQPFMLSAYHVEYFFNFPNFHFNISSTQFREPISSLVSCSPRFHSSHSISIRIRCKFA